MKEKVFLMSCMISASLAGCSNDDTSTVEDIKESNETAITRTISLTDAQRSAVAKNNDFAFNFFRQVSQEEMLKGKNVFTSPLSATYLLGMLNEGAQGKTSEEITAMLGFLGSSKAEVNQLCKTLIDEAPLVDEQVTLKLADCIVSDPSVTLASSYQKSLADNYRAEAFSKSFADAATVDFINDWCREHTEGMIPKFVDSLDPATCMMLMNAVYFKAAWSGKFKKEETRDEKFTREDGTQVTLPMMHRLNGTAYYKNDVYTSIGLPYGNGDKWRFYALLPHEGKTVADVINGLTQASWEANKSKMTTEMADVKLPRFKTESELGLNAVCKALGAQSLFSQTAADFRLMTDSQMPLWVDLIKQKTAIEVSEEGTEASALTGAIVVTTNYGGGGDSTMPVFHATRPFVYLIQEASSGAIFFIGTFKGN